MKIKTVVVTGATGFLGGRLVQRLLKDDIKVYAVDINEARLKDISGCKNVVTILASCDEMEKIIKKINEPIDVWYHFAFAGSFGGDSLKDYSLQLQNAKYACDAVEAAIRLKVTRFVFASTVNEIEAITYMKESFTEPRYTCIYSGAKIAAEIIGRTMAYNNEMEFLSGLISMPYGENNYAKNLPNILIHQFIKGSQPKLIEGNNKYDLVYVDDIAEAFVKIGQRGINMKSYYVGHRNLPTFKELITEIKDILAPECELKFGEYKDGLDLDYSQIDLDALYNDTGFECKADFKESIIKTAEWVSTLGW